MLHAREDYNAIQPWPTKRPHHGLVDEEEIKNRKYLNLTNDSLEQLGNSVKPIIPDDEPVFLIRAQDSIGPAVVRYWAGLAENADVERRVIDAVYDWADRMENYALKEGAKTADTPQGLLFTEQ